MAFAEQYLESQRVLIVDDEPYVGEILGRWLRDEGYECATAADAEGAVPLLEAGGIALVVADIRLPGRSGIELLAQIKESHPGVAVIIITAVNDCDTAVRAFELGAFGYVVKPFDHNEVLINVANAMERRRRAEASKQYERCLEDRVHQAAEELRASREEIALRLMAAQEYRHDETGAHIRRIGLYSEAVALRLGYPRDEAGVMRLAAPMHDVGKIGIPDSILMRPGKLSRLEWQIMKTHTSICGRILEGTTLPLLNTAREIALGHHERWDGSGYPRHLPGTDIPECARIVAVLDAYDALVSERVYRPAMPEELALTIMEEGAGSHFDPRIYGVFRAVLPGLRRIGRRVAEETPNKRLSYFRPGTRSAG